MSKKLIIAIDFDGTIVEHKFPEIGKPMPGAIEAIKAIQDAGHKIFLWTCREDDGYKINKQYLKKAVEFCEKHGIKFDAINESVDDFRSHSSLSRKPYANYYIDDSIIGGFPGWDKIRKELDV